MRYGNMRYDPAPPQPPPHHGEKFNAWLVWVTASVVFLWLGFFALAYEQYRLHSTVSLQNQVLFYLYEQHIPRPGQPRMLPPPPNERKLFDKGEESVY